MENAAAKFIEVTTIDVGLMGAKSRQNRAMIDVESIFCIQSCTHQEEPKVRTMIDMHSLKLHLGPKRYFLADDYDTVSNLVKNAGHATNPTEWRD